MRVRKCLISACVAALAFGSAAFAADVQTPVSAASSDLSLMPVYMDTSGPTSLTPLMYVLDGTSFGKWMEDNKIDITGFVEGGYFYDTSNPRLGTGLKGNAPTNIGFPGSFSNRGLLDQADLDISKTIDHSKTWDFGFNVEQGYGADDAQIHSDGMLDNNTSTENQYDIIQANASILMPVGSGLTVEFGKFPTLLGYEYINPTLNQFYTHSYEFSFGIPLTQTGVLGSYTFAKAINGNDLTITAGFTEGWNQSLRDNNGAIDFLGEATSSITDKLAFTFNVSEGPEAAGDNSDYWTVLELIPTYKVSDQLSVAWDILYGDFPHGATTVGGNSAQWLALASYASYKINNYVTLNLRDEWYRDQGGFTNNTNITGTNGAGAPLLSPAGVSANYYEITFGAQIKPFPNDNIFQWLQFRPEVRFDYSDQTVFNHAHTGTINPAGDYDQFTVAMDAIMQF
jgi:hypothetical protein